MQIQPKNLSKNSANRPALSTTSKKRPATHYLIWLDLEMTGLDPERERIIEIALIVTDLHLHIVAEFPGLAIFQPDNLLHAMDSWNKRHHQTSGLLERVRASRISEAQAEWRALDFLQSYVKPQSSPLCGNTVHQDRRFLTRYMPKLESYFHYRNLDVSTLKELANYWRPEVASLIKKDRKHLALDDIKDSIIELQTYRQYFLR